MKVLLLAWLLGSSTFLLSHEGEPFIQDCNDDYSSCNVKVITNNKTIISVLDDYPFYSSIVHHEKDIVQVIANCGSPCQSYIFVNLKTSEVEHIVNPVKFSSKYSLAAFINDRQLVIKKLFVDEVLSTEKLEFSPVANINSAIKNFEFTSHSSIKITYLSTSKYIRKTKEIIF